jgi:hypothetical protein
LTHLLGMVGKPPKLDIVAEFGVFYAKDEKDGSDDDSDGSDDDESDDGSDLDVEDAFKSAWGGFKEVVKDAAEEVAEEAANEFLEPFVNDIANEGFERIECFNYSSQAGQLL